MALEFLDARCAAAYTPARAARPEGQSRWCDVLVNMTEELKVFLGKIKRNKELEENSSTAQSLGLGRLELCYRRRRPVAPTNEPRPEAPRLAHLDGLRAVAATYVVLFHAALGFPGDQPAPFWWRVIRRGFAFGHEAVAIFIVLSGYCLMLPVVRAGQGRLPGGLAAYLGRRAFRILPPYFAALAASALAIALLAPLQVRSATIWDDSLPGLTAGALLSHLALVHNWFPAWGYQINGPFWSVATEWQIYFFFPLVLLPVWRRAGVAGALVVALALGYLPHLLAPERAAVAIPWYLALFWLGAAAATGIWRAAPWGVLAGLLWSLCAVLGLGFAPIFFLYQRHTDLLVGLATAALLAHLDQRAAAARDGHRRGRLLSWLESRPAAAVGRFSYSLYLTHLPVVALCFPLVHRLDLPEPAHAAAMLLLAVPASFLVAYGFFWLVERHFLRWRRR